MENFLTGMLIGMFAGILVGVIKESKHIHPMDVYQGKTTLEYKVVDGEIVDSCVVWKSK